MKKPKTKAARFSKKQIVLLLITGIVVVLVGLWSWNQIAPRPLGNDLTYIGKKDFGGWFMKPYSRYYYETSMRQEELKSYFSQASYKSSDNILSALELRGEDMRFTSASGNFIVSYYDHPDMTLKAVGLSSSTSSDYDIARKSL
jgi:hypothetical protein